MKIYEFKHDSGNTDWVFAPNIKEAKEFYLNFTKCGDLSLCEVKSVPKKEWESNYLLDVNEPEPYDDEDYEEGDYACGYKIVETFAEYAARNTQTDMIATTDF